MARRQRQRGTWIGGALASCIALGCASTAREAAPASAAAVVAAAESGERVIDVNGAILHYRIAGEGVPVVFVHGSMSDMHTWDAQRDAFARSFVVVTYSRRFHPPNAPPGAADRYSAAQHATDLAALVRQLGLGPVHVVGSSYGAYAGLLFALRHPELTRSLVLGEPPLLPLLGETPEGEVLRRAFVANTLAPAGEAFRAGDMEEGFRRFMGGVTGVADVWDRMPEPRRRELLKAGPEMRAELTTDPAEYMPTVSCTMLRGLGVPVLVLRGARSGALFAAINDRLDACLEGERDVTIPETGHAIHFNVVGYNETVLGFLLAQSP